jgi:hypothetical protein
VAIETGAVVDRSRFEAALEAFMDLATMVLLSNPAGYFQEWLFAW